MIAAHCMMDVPRYGKRSLAPTISMARSEILVKNKIRLFLIIIFLLLFLPSIMMFEKLDFFNKTYPTKIVRYLDILVKDN